MVLGVAHASSPRHRRMAVVELWPAGPTLPDETARCLSGAHALGRAGSHDLSIGELDDELPIGSEREDPATSVGAVVVMAAKWKEVGEVGRPTVAPPVHVMRFGVSERHVATRYGARGIDRRKGSLLGPVCQTCTSFEVEVAVGVNDRPVVNDHRPDMRGATQVLDPLPTEW